MKIYIFGQSGGGKTTLARKVAEQRNLPLFELDEIWLKHPGRHYGMNHPKRQEARINLGTEVKKILRRKNWVIDGNYRYVRPTIMKAADQLVFLDIPIRKRVANNLRRHFAGDGKKIDKFWRQHLPRITRYVWSRKRATLSELKPYQSKVIHLKNRREIDRYLKNLKIG